MKNLLKEINDNKLLSNSKISEDFKRGFNRGLDLSQEIINQYNIITAPKSIKLSEVVSKLTKDFPAHNFYYRYDTKWIAIWLGNHCYATFAIKDNKLVLENKDEFEYPKWLYTLWIAGTHIVDDMEEEE